MRRYFLLLLAGLTAVLAWQKPAPKPIALFNGKDLTGWTHYLWNNAERKQDTTTPVSDVWTVKDGVLFCAGRPTGYIRTNEEYDNYKLSVEWRWPEGTTGGNNGVLVHTTTPNALGQWPKSIEVQLAFGQAGDFWVIGTTLEVPDIEKRRQGRRHLNLTDNSEKPAGEWNKMEITCKGDEVIVHVNGDLVNHATKCNVTKGAISLQSEGAPVEFRNIYLTHLE
ncbi:MAG: 3-keto-disaccharide hydrolase [Bryobacteraceae bacterium]